jgi:hypothetical protein
LEQGSGRRRRDYAVVVDEDLVNCRVEFPAEEEVVLVVLWLE